MRSDTFIGHPSSLAVNLQSVFFIQFFFILCWRRLIFFTPISLEDHVIPSLLPPPPPQKKKKLDKKFLALSGNKEILVA